MSEFAEDLEAGVNLVACQRLQALGTETLDGEGSHDPAVEESALDDLAIQLWLRGDVSHEPAGKRVAGAGWVFHFFNWQCGCAEGMSADPNGPFAEENRGTVFTMFDNQRLRAEGKHFAGCAGQAGFLGQHLRLAVVDQKDIHQTQGFSEFGIGALNPEIHGVAASQFYVR